MTDAQLKAYLKALLDEGHAHAQIGRMLGCSPQHATRIIHRLGLRKPTPAVRMSAPVGFLRLLVRARRDRSGEDIMKTISDLIESIHDMSRSERASGLEPDIEWTFETLSRRKWGG